LFRQARDKKPHGNCTPCEDEKAGGSEWQKGCGIDVKEENYFQENLLDIDRCCDILSDVSILGIKEIRIKEVRVVENIRDVE